MIPDDDDTRFDVRKSPHRWYFIVGLITLLILLTLFSDILTAILFVSVVAVIGVALGD